MRFIGLAISVAMLLSVSALAAEPQPAAQTPVSNPDSGMAIPTTTASLSNKPADKVLACFRMRTYRVRKDLDRNSVIPATPDEVTFDPDTIVSYSTCQRADKFDFRTTH